MINEWFPFLGPHQLGKLKDYRDLLVKFNDSINLISPNSTKAVDNVHLADSIAASRFILGSLNSDPVYDLGSGNGLPGIVMGILAPEKKIVLIDRDLKKTEFLKHVVGALKLENVSCVAKNLGQDRDLVINQSISRAMAPLGRFASTMGSAFPVGGKCFLMKTPKWEAELAPDHGHLKKQWSWSVVFEYELPEDRQKRIILEIVKKEN